MKHNGRKLGNCTCDFCGVEFQKPLSELKRNLSLGRKNFCSRTCVGKNSFLNPKKPQNRYDISKHCGWKRDEFTKFRYHFRNISKRDKDINVTLEDLKSTWESQGGKCVYLGIDLILSNYTKIEKSAIYSASLDRIDSSKGYVKGNIQWVSRSINHLKGDMSHDEVLEIIQIIKKTGE